LWGSLFSTSILSDTPRNPKLNRHALRCLFDLCLVRVVVVCSALRVSAQHASILKFRRQGEGTPKIASPRPRNMAAQIYVNFDRYISMNSGTIANLFEKSISMDRSASPQQRKIPRPAKFFAEIPEAQNFPRNCSARLSGLAERITLALWQLSYRQCKRATFGACG
jgi:hypothetical protein